VPQARVRLGHGGHPRGEIELRLLAVDRHQVEDLAHALQRAGDDVELAGGLARVVELDGQAEPLQHRVLRDLLALVGRGLGAQRGDGLPLEFGLRAEAVRAQIRQPVVVSGDAAERALIGFSTAARSTYRSAMSSMWVMQPHAIADHPPGHARFSGGRR